MTLPASPTTSIAMCTYNGARFLQKQLDSFAAQTVLPGELVVCDDGSTDNTLKILETFAQTAPFPVRVLQNETNLGHTRNFERAALMCRNDIIFFSDQDDIWLPEKVERVLDVFRRQPEVGLVLTSASVIDEEDRVVEKYWIETSYSLREVEEPFTLDMFRQRRFTTWPGCNMAYRNSLRDWLYPIRCICGGHDAWVMSLLMLLTEVRVLQAPLDLHRFHNRNTSRIPRGLRRLRKSGSLPSILKRYYFRHLDPLRLLIVPWQLREMICRHDSFPGTKNHPEVLACYQRIQSHYIHRVMAISHLSLRPFIVFSEMAKGNYHLMEKPVRNILCDLFALPMPLHSSGFSKLDDLFEEQMAKPDGSSTGGPR